MFISKFTMVGIVPKIYQCWTKQLSLRTMTLSSNLTFNDIPTKTDNRINNYQRRAIYSESILMIDKLDSMQHYKNQQFGADKSRYIQRVKNMVESGQMEMVLRDDLINLIGLADNEEHLDLIEKIISERVLKRLNNDEKGWGTAIMRLYYKFGLTERAFNNIQDVKTFGNFFSQMSSYRIVMTMLYNDGRYEDVTNLYDKYCTEKPGFDENNENIFQAIVNRLRFIVLASYAKLNTPDALKRAQSVDMREDSARCTMFMAYLALNQNQPNLALDYMSRCEKANHIAIKSLKIKAYMKMKRFEDVLIIIHRSLDMAAKGRQIMLKDTCEMMEEYLSQVEDEIVRNELSAAIKDIQNNGLISPQCVEDFVFKPLTLMNREVQDVRNERGSVPNKV